MNQELWDKLSMCFLGDALVPVTEMLEDAEGTEEYDRIVGRLYGNHIINKKERDILLGRVPFQD